MKRRFDFWHPSNHRLRHWLDTGDPEGVGEHVEQCERCADRLEQFDAALVEDGSDGPSALRQALTAMLTPPDDLTERVLHGVEVRSRGDEELRLLAGLFSIGVETAQLMLAPGHGQDRDAVTNAQDTPDAHEGADPEEDDRT